MKKTAARVLVGALAAAGLVLGIAGGAAGRTSRAPTGLQKIQHIVIIMQENRSFDHYFGTYPGADGIPMRRGVPTVCVPDPETRTCIKPFHDALDLNHGGPHSAASAVTDVDGGRMDGFIWQAQRGRNNCADPLDPACAGNGFDAVGYHDRREIPNYWAYADNFVLQDRMFDANASLSLPQHLFMLAEWSARCGSDDPARRVDA